ncbi:HupE/UreJ family protein [Lyngbya confervoides]|uniref:HupE/UreJ family protein n=1 Tax=Lyngbya confervoides BDU141951 TaxID=1574623 RepID=A0ABD4T104_9CYAN|nr:HupE/UreJ family protein [Lyngbya confervoides]MCM1982308.1 HupE/UreJ family protein [Lyngbya confervoides BDU141951]
MSFVIGLTQWTVQRLPGRPSGKRPWLTRAGLGLGLLSLGIGAPAWAHHPLGGRLPSTFLEGFLSGLGHPVLGLDHLAFVLALGVIAAQLQRAIWIPVGFAIATLMGVGGHLLTLDVPGAESIVAGTLIVLGLLFILSDRLQTPGLLAIGSLAGLFHGYAYGEAIIGSEMSPLLAYLLGLTVIQIGMALFSFGIAKVVTAYAQSHRLKLLRGAGLLVGTLGIILLRRTLMA